jgi:hypothetical protein
LADRIPTKVAVKRARRAARVRRVLTPEQKVRAWFPNLPVEDEA